MDDSTLVPSINRDCQHICTLADYVKTNLHPHLLDYSVISIIGKPTPTKYKTIKNLFGVHAKDETLPDQILNLSHSQQGKHFIHDVNIANFDFYMEKEYKVLYFSSLIARHLIFLVHQQELRAFNYNKTLTTIIHTAFSARDGIINPRKVSFLIDVSQDSMNFLQTREFLVQNLRQAWNAALKPPEMHDLDFDDIIDLEIKTFTQYELDAPSYSGSRLIELDNESTSPFKSLHRATFNVFGGFGKSGNSAASSPLKLSANSQDFSGKSEGYGSQAGLQKKVVYPFEFYLVYYEDLWNFVNSTTKLTELYEINCSERMFGLLENEFENRKKKIMNEMIFQVIQLRERVDEERLVHDFAAQAKKLHENVVIELIKLGIQRNLEFFYQRSDRLEEEKKDILPKVEFELFNLFQNQVAYLKDNVIENFVGRIENARRRLGSEEEYAMELKGFIEREAEDFLNELKEILSQLKVSIVGFKLRWDVMIYYEEMKAILDEFLKQYIEEETERVLQSIVMNARSSLKGRIGIRDQEGQTVWENAETVLGSVIPQNAAFLGQFLAINTASTEEEIEKNVLEFKQDCFEYGLSLLREEATEIGSKLYVQFEKKFQDNFNKRLKGWLWRGQATALAQLELSYLYLSQASLKFLDQLKEVSVSRRFFRDTLKSDDDTRVFLSEAKFNQVKSSFTTKAQGSLAAKQALLKSKFKTAFREKILFEVLFWVAWLLLLYLYINRLDNFYLLGFLLLLVAVKGLQYSGVFRDLINKAIKFIQDTFGEESPGLAKPKLL